MKESSVARQALIKDRTAALNRQKVVRSALLRRQLKLRLRQIAHHLVAIDAQLQSLCLGDADLTPRLAILMSIPGIARATALSLLVELPELVSLDQSQVASLPGLAPVARDSGLHAVAARSGAGAPFCVRRCTCRPWRPPASTRI
jgi:transposase